MTDLRAIAAAAGDEVIPGLWATSRTARLAALNELLGLMDGDDSPQIAVVRAEVIEQVFAELDAAEQEVR